MGVKFKEFSFLTQFILQSQKGTSEIEKGTSEIEKGTPEIEKGEPVNYFGECSGVFTELCLPYIFLEKIYTCLLGYFY